MRASSNQHPSATVREPSHREKPSAQPIGWAEYLRVPLMATVLGLIAGVVGSGLEDHQTVREAAYSQREQQRRELTQR